RCSSSESPTFYREHRGPGRRLASPPVLWEFPQFSLVLYPRAREGLRPGDRAPLAFPDEESPHKRFDLQKTPHDHTDWSILCRDKRPENPSKKIPRPKY